MNEILKVFMSLSVSGGLLALILLIFKPLYKNHLRKSWQYYIWLVVLLRMLLPFTPEVNLIGLFSAIGQPSQAQTYTLPSTALFDTSPVQNQNTGKKSDKSPNLPAESYNPVKNDDLIINKELIITDNPVITNKTAGKIFLDILLIIIPYLWLVWPLTALLLLLRKIVSYQRYISFIRMGRRELNDLEITEIYKTICSDMGIKRRIPIYVSRCINTPMLVCIIKPYIVLPEAGFSESNYRMMLSHELTHYKRQDILYKWFVQVIICLHWFNPIIYLVRKEIYKNCELSCDEAVLSLFGFHSKRSYGDALLASIQGVRNHESTAVSITMSEDGRNLKERLESIMKYSNKSIIIRIFTVVLSLILIAGAFFLGSYTGTRADKTQASTGDGLLKDGDMLNGQNDGSIDSQVNDNNSSLLDLTNTSVDLDDLSEDSLLKLKEAERAAKELLSEDMKLLEEKLDSQLDYLTDKNSQLMDNNLVYANLDELKKLVFDEAKVTEHEFDNISVIDISTIGDNVKITQGGDKLFIRYSEWFENEYSLNVTDGKLSLYQNQAPNYIKANGSISSDWIFEYLKSQGKQFYHTVEIIIPSSMPLDSIIDTMSGNIEVNGCKIDGNLTTDTMSGYIEINGSEINGNLTTGTMSGYIEINGCKINGNLAANTMSGNVDVINCEMGGSLVIDTMSSTVYVESCIFSSLTIDTLSGSGNIILSGKTAANHNLSFDTLSGTLTYNGKLIEDNKIINNQDSADRIRLSSMSGSFTINDAD